MKTYEAMLIFLSNLKEEEIEKGMKTVHSEIARLGGTVQDTLALGRRTFARQLKKNDEGMYFRIQFGLAPDQLVELRSRLKLNAEVFRMQIERAVATKAHSVKTAKAETAGEEAEHGQS